MRKTLFLSLIYMLTFCGVALAQDIGGFWKTVDEKTGKAESIIALYQYQGKYFGRIIGSFDDNGNIKDSIYAPKGRATGVDGSPYYCGMDIIWNVQKRKSKYKGKIMDPRNGKVYNAGLWIRDGDLVVRGELLFFIGPNLLKRGSIQIGWRNIMMNTMPVFTRAL